MKRKAQKVLHSESKRYKGLAKYANYAVTGAKVLSNGMSTARKIIRKYRNGKSKTKTKTKPRFGLTRGERADGVSKSYGQFTLYKKPLLRRTWNVGEFSSLENAVGFSVVSSAGANPAANELNRQCRQTVSTYGKGSSLLQLFTQGYSSNTDYVVLNPTLSPYSYNGRFVYKGIKGSFEFTNQEQTNTSIKIYMCIARTDDNTCPLPTTTWEEGLDETAGSTGATFANNYMPNTSPNLSKKFRNLWRIGNVATVHLQPGQTHKHFWAHKVNKTLSISEMNDKDMLKDVTVSFMFVARGVPVDFDATHTHGAATLIAYSPTKLVGVVSTKYDFAPVFALPANHLQNNALYSGAPTVINLVNEESGAVKDLFPVGEVA